MSSFYGETEDPDYGDSLFPAYTDYINGVDTRSYEAHEFDLNPLLYQHPAPIPYTNSMPLCHILSQPNNAVPTRFGVQASPAVLDLRLPSVYPDMVNLLPPETPQFAPRPPPVPAFFIPYAIKHEHPVSSAEITKQKLLGASLQQSTGPPPQSPVQQFPHNLAEHYVRDNSLGKRRMPARQATHPSLLRSSSATDIDSQAGTMPPSRSNMLQSAHSPSPAVARVHLLVQQPPQQSFDLKPNPGLQQPGPLASPHGLPRPPSVPHVQPGDILNDPRYAAASEPKRQRMNAHISELYNIAYHHPDPESRQQAHINIANCNANVNLMMQDWGQVMQRRLMDEAVQKHVQSGMQRSHACLPEMENSFSEPQNFPEDYEHPTLSPQYQPCAIAIAHEQQHPQQLPRHRPYGKIDLSQSKIPTPGLPDLRALIDAQVSKFMYADGLMNSSEMDASSLALRARAQNWQNNFRASLPPEGLQYLDKAVARMSARQVLDSHRPVQRHQPVPDYQQHQPARLDQSDDNPQKHYQPNRSPQPQLPLVPVSKALRQHIHANLRQFFAAMRASSQPPTPNNAEMQQKARDFQVKFKASLPPEGHVYIEEVVTRMSIERAEGRDPMNAMPV